MRAQPVRRWRVLPLVLAVVSALVAPLAGGVVSPAAAAPTPLTNLAHLNFLGDRITPPAQAGHTTYRLRQEPSVGVLWTYADRNADGTYRRVGGGAYDPATNTWGQGAFNADDISRAAVVYLRHWRQTGAASSRRAAYDLLRGLTYLQTVRGPNAGNVVLWQQPDGTLNPSAEPVELPDPSDSGPSYWLARTVWALGEGYAAFRRADPAFAGFLRDRMELSIDALERQVLVRYGRYQVVDGERVPAWLIVDGADATAEAVLGLSAYVDAGGSRAARRALKRFAEGVAALSAGDARSWPYAAILPWAISRSVWHAWASQMPAALAVASRTLGERRLLRPAVADAAVFTPHLLTARGPDNGWLPAPSERVQIAYGVDSRLQSLLAVARVADRPGLRPVAALTAAWYFGANPAGTPMYDPATGRTFDGIEPDGRVNRNSGAESTIHGLLSMLALDARPGLAERATALTSIEDRDGVQIVEAESGDLAGAAQVVRPDSAWTGESLWSGGAYVALDRRGRAVWTVPAADQPRLVQPIVDLVEGRRTDAGVAEFTARGRLLGRVDAGDGGRQGASPAPGSLQPVTLRRELPGGVTRVRAVADGPVRIDALRLQPVVMSVVLGGDDAGLALLHSAARGIERRTVAVPGSGRAVVTVLDRRGEVRLRYADRGARFTVPVLPGGSTTVAR